ncbi:hypothetical protein EZV62_009535 [Acer yangbiense]|uniref:Uncharacterized protein n=1 Tax=Acer yangbiense TaxID=1000413 RepID=A0A5C7HZH8_9ROSI|nr:hypothetical protein EZV62_009535 [Acer yangbiense]
MDDINNSANPSTDVRQNGSEEVIIDVLDDHWVPIDLRNIHKKAYTPQVISIGSLHHGKGKYELKGMQKQKKRYKHKYIERKGNEKWEEMKFYIKSKEKEIRNCYEQPSLLKSDPFVDMILDDAVFIIELFLRNYHKVADFLLEKPRYKNTIKRDLQLLENQLPYFVLLELYRSATNGFDFCRYIGSSSTDPPFLHISCNFFGYKSYDISKMDGFNVKHFTDLRRYFLIEDHPMSKIQDVDLPMSKTQYKVVDLPCATKLDASGVRFKLNKNKGALNEDCLLDLNFDNGRKRGLKWSCIKLQLPFCKKYELQIPRITVNDRTEPLIRNVMALEQCHYPKETHVCNYIAFMDFLINTEKDADLLIEKGIIVNCLGENKAIAKMFNSFCLQTSTSPSCFFDMAKELKEHCDSRYHKAKATLKSVYFSNPWKGTGTVVGIIILLLTFVITLYSIMRFMRTN